MGFARKLQRALDIDLIERIESSGSQVRVIASKTSTSQPRPSGSYRGTRRNAAKTMRKATRRRTVSDAMLTFAQVQELNRMYKARMAADAKAKAESAA